MENTFGCDVRNVMLKVDASAYLVIKFERFNMLYFKVVLAHDKECKNCHIQPPATVKVNVSQLLIKAAKHNAEKELPNITENPPDDIEGLSNNPANIYLFKIAIDTLEESVI